LLVQVAASVAQAAQQGFIPDVVPPERRGTASGLKGFMDVGGALLAPYTRMQLEDAPALGDGTVGADDPYKARAYWLFEERAAPFTRMRRSTLGPRWHGSSGSSATEKRFPTTPRPTTTAS
jgi:hypothetical protein